MSRLIILLIIVVVAGCTSSPPPATPPRIPLWTATVAVATAPPTVPAATAVPTIAAVPARDQVEVIEVIDGNTIRVRFGHGQVETVRYLGIEAPTAPACFSNEAAEKNAELVGGRAVELERSPVDGADEAELLRYVWVTGDDGATRFVNEELVKFGFARATSSPRNVLYQALLQAAEQTARRQKAGLWDACGAASLAYLHA